MRAPTREKMIMIIISPSRGEGIESDKRTTGTSTRRTNLQINPTAAT